MRITTQLRIISTVTIAALVVLVPVLVWSFIEFNSARNDYVLADAIHDNFFERDSFRDQYFLYREDRARVQWDKSNKIAGRLLRQAEGQFHSEKSQQILQRLRRHNEDGAVIFYRIVNNTEVLKTAVGNHHVYEELDKRLFSQLLLKAAAVRNMTTALQNVGAKRVELTYQYLTIIIGLFAVTLALATILTSMHLIRLIRKRLAPLHDGAKIVADGDLGYRIQCGGSDEFAELALSINSMTDKLQDFTKRLETDIIELKRTDAALQASEERWKFALEGAGDGVWDWNPKADEALFSKRWKEMIGYAEHEFPSTGAAWVEHLHPDDMGRVLSSLQDYFAGNLPLYIVEFRMRCKDGFWKWILARGMLVNRDVNGNPLRMIGTHTDITERKKAEERLRESEARYKLMALHLDNVRGEERVRIARELHDEMGATLTALKMRVHWLASKQPDEMMKFAPLEAEYMDKLVSDAIHTMRNVVSQLMPTLLHDLGFAAAVMHHVQNFQKSMGIDCRLAFPEEELTLDENQSSAMFRILQESLNNVVKHAQATMVSILFINRNHSLILVVKDNGVGFDRNMHKNNSFGLLGIRERARMVNGNGRISSKPGKGTQVVISIPLVGKHP